MEREQDAPLTVLECMDGYVRQNADLAGREV